VGFAEPESAFPDASVVEGGETEPEDETVPDVDGTGAAVTAPAALTLKARVPLAVVCIEPPDATWTESFPFAGVAVTVYAPGTRSKIT
jgi:hypothetical protein